MVNGWKEKPLGSDNLAIFDYDNLNSTTPFDYRFKYITLENVNEGKISKLIECCFKTSPSRARRIVHKDDVLIATVRPLLHSHYFVNDEVNNVVCSTGFCVVKTNEEQLHNKYLYQLLFYWTIDNQIESITAGSNYPSINSNDVKKLIIPLPPLPEQRRIAAALSDTDALISALEKLIVKKRAIKQGAMQELLTGKRRLPGFGGKWVEKRLGELLKYEQPQKYIVSNTEYSTSGTPVLTAGKSLVLGYIVETEGVYDNLPVIIFDDFTTESKLINFKFKVKSSAMKLLTSTNMCDIRIVFEHMQMIDFPLRDHQRYWISEYSKIFVKIPPTISEQTAIAQILSDMDAEIDTLTTKLNKLRRIKQGMMSELLTGRIRLVEQEGIAVPEESNTNG